MSPSSVQRLSDGEHKRLGVCLALVGSRQVETAWAVQALNIQFPPNARQTLFCLAHDDLDTARNLALADWSRAPRELRADWIALVATGSKVRGDGVCACIAAGDAVSHIDGSYVLRRDAIEGTDPPWFAGGRWCGRLSVVERADLSTPALGDARLALDVASSPEDPNVAKKMVVFCVPTLGTTTLVWTVSAIMLQAPMACAGSLVLAQGHEIGEARQRLVEAVLAMDPRPEYMLFYGDDNLPPPDGLQTLMDTARRSGELAVSGLYHIKHYPPTQAIMWKNDRPGPLIAGVDYTPDETVRVDGCGLDFILFRTDALAKLPPLKFRTVVDWVPGRGMRLQTEDAFFFDRWREVHGVGPVVDTRVRVGHLDARTGGVY